MKLRLLFATAAAAFAFVSGPVGAHDMEHMTMDAPGQPMTQWLMRRTTSPIMRSEPW